MIRIRPRQLAVVGGKPRASGDDPWLAGLGLSYLW